MLATKKIERIPIVERGDLMIDPQCHIVKVCDEEIDLYPKEIDVLYFLARYPGWVLTPECNYCCSARVVATVKSTFSIFSSHFGKRRMRE